MKNIKIITILFILIILSSCFGKEENEMIDIGESVYENTKVNSSSSLKGF